MAGRNGAGVFTVTNPDFISGTTISSSQMDANFGDVSTGLTGSIAADGQTTVTANLPLNNNKLTGLAVGSASADSITYGQALVGLSVKGGDISSASPLVIDTDGNYFDVTGTTGFAAMTVAAGRMFYLQFDGALIMTHHATNLDLPGEANITTVAGDVAIFQSTGANTVQCVAYTRADGTAIAQPTSPQFTTIQLGHASDTTLARVSSGVVSIEGVSVVTTTSTATLTGKTFDANGTGNSLSNVDVADLAAGTDGELITWAADASPATVAVGDDGMVLTSNGAGAAPTFQAAASGEQLKGWLSYDQTGTAAILDSLNVTSVADTATGNWTVTWGTDFADTNYLSNPSALTSGGTYLWAVVHARAAGTTQVITGKHSDNGLADSDQAMVLALGDQ